MLRVGIDRPARPRFKGGYSTAGVGMIEQRAAKWSGLILGIVVITWCMLVMYGAPLLGVQELHLLNASDGMELLPSSFAIPVSDVLLAVHVLFAGFAIANLIYYATIVISYRRLANG
ncbi:MAG: hypothetical protein ACI814_001315 [Mariniblastus sp.]|jgi:hypothetical protein